MNLQFRIWISKAVLLIVPVLTGILLFFLYFTGIRVLAGFGYYVRLDQEQQYRYVVRFCEALTFYSLDGNVENSVFGPVYSVLNPSQVYVEVLDYGRVVYRYGNPKIYNSSATVGLMDANPELMGIMYESNNTYVYETRRTLGAHQYVYHFAGLQASNHSDDLLETVYLYIMVVSAILLIITFFGINRFVAKFLMVHVKGMTKSLEDANRKIEQEQEQQKELLAGISHDIRTPLTAIKAYAEGVRDGIAPTEEQRNRYMNIILKRVSDLEAMLEELFLITTVDYKKQSRPTEIIELGKYVVDFCEENRGHYRAKGLSLEVRIAEETFIRINPQLLQRVLQNILSNSAKYKLGTTGHCVLDVVNNGDTVSCIITDDGPGVPPESLDRLMRPFYRVDSSRTNPQEGSGLGLSIIRRIMDVSHGTVQIENVEPHGLKIILEFPFERT